MKELMFLKELTLISQINQKSGYNYEPHVFNRCNGLSMMVYDLNDFMILNIEGVDYRCHVFNTTKSDAINLLNNSVLDNKGVL